MKKLNYVFHLVLGIIKKMSTHNRCDSCGFTKDDVYVTEYFTEAGWIECGKCYNARTIMSSKLHKMLDTFNTKER
jgi:hypothetical protein